MFTLLQRASQYLVSLASFRAIDIFDIKSALLWPAWASSTLAPIDVPERKSCLDRSLFNILAIINCPAKFNNSNSEIKSSFANIFLFHILYLVICNS